MASEILRWEGTARNRAVMLSAGLVVGLGVLGFTSGEQPGLVYGLVMAAVAWVVAGFSSIKVTIDQQRFVVRSPLFPWALRSVPLNEIRKAEATSITPLKLGGWGYRFCGRRCWAVVVRKGEAIRLELPGDKTFMVTVGHAQAGAKWVADHLAQLPGTNAT